MKVTVSSSKVTTQFWPELLVLAIRTLVLAGVVVGGAKEVKESWQELRGQKK